MLQQRMIEIGSQDFDESEPEDEDSQSLKAEAGSGDSQQAGQNQEIGGILNWRPVIESDSHVAG